MALAKSIKEAFKFEGAQLRVYGTVEAPWFCGRDICNILEYKDAINAMKEHVDIEYICKLGDIFKGGDLPPLKGNAKNMNVVNEQGLYCLIFNSKMEKAKQFRKWVFEDVLPSIRKKGYFVDPRIDDEKVSGLLAELEEQKRLNAEHTAQLNRLHNTQKELLSYKKRVTKTETIYIVSTSNYARQGIFKVGRTKQTMVFRSSSHNVTHIPGDKCKVLRTFNVNDSVLVERNVHTKLNGLLLEGEKEHFMVPYDLLESLVDLIVHNDDEENAVMNRIIDAVYKLKNEAFNTVNWIQGIPASFLVERLVITAGDEKMAELDVTAWNEEQKQAFVAACLREYVKIQTSINAAQEQIIWKTFQTFLIEHLNLAKSRFKANKWKPAVQLAADAAQLSIKWRG